MASSLKEGINGEIDKLVVDGDLDFHLGNEVGNHHESTVDFGDFLLAVPVYAGDGDAAGLGGNEGFSYFVELVFLNNGRV